MTELYERDLRPGRHFLKHWMTPERRTKLFQIQFKRTRTNLIAYHLSCMHVAGYVIELQHPFLIVYLDSLIFRSIVYD